MTALPSVAAFEAALFGPDGVAAGASSSRTDSRNACWPMPANTTSPSSLGPIRTFARRRPVDTPRFCLVLRNSDPILCYTPDLVDAFGYSIICGSPIPFDRLGYILLCPDTVLQSASELDHRMVYPASAAFRYQSKAVTSFFSTPSPDLLVPFPSGLA